MDNIPYPASCIRYPVSGIQPRTLYPVILPVPEQDRPLTGREKVKLLSGHARRALEMSAQKTGIILKELQKDKNGAPLPFNGNYWSLTHKTCYVGAVVAFNRIGIDIEKIRPCSEALFKKTADIREWNLADARSPALFFRYWTAKECVLKAACTGIRDLKKCRIVQLVDDRNLVITYQDKTWYIEHLFFDGHIASVVKNDLDVQWILSPN
ncbi:MAG: 4'-phosphopantetheinyl transferase superfamily protein [Proteobacteria bacterium]|nr:4'-phosphopantetheinyl transferase superfamily protein [Pseudomonadota bacterium]